MEENDFGIEVQVVDRDTADQRITDPVSNDDEIFDAQVDNETP